MSGPLFTAIGEILIDFTPLVENGRTVGFRMHPGGSPFNVAVGLARLGARVEFAAKISTDFFGRFLLGHLEREGIGGRFLSRADAPTTLAFVALEGGEPAFSFYQNGTADTLLRPEDVPSGDIAACRALHFGSISLLQEPTASTITGLVERLQGGPLLSFDPNIRPDQVADPPAFRSLIGRLFQAADLVKISAADLRWLAPARAIEDAAADILMRGPALIIVTLGAKGCYALSGRAARYLPAPHVDVVDTVGAGDAFTAGLLYSLAERNLLSAAGLRAASGQIEEALRFALAAAALNCARPGANPPRREEVERFLAR